MIIDSSFGYFARPTYNERNTAPPPPPTGPQSNSCRPPPNQHRQPPATNTFIKLDDASYRQSSIAIVGSSITAYLREIGIGFSQAAATPAAAQAQDEKADGQKGVRP